MSNCLFCAIGAGEVASDVVLETEHLVAFRDIDPQAPTHVLVIPREHHANIGDLTRDNPDIALALFRAAADVANLETLEKGYRVVTNTGSDGGQSVHHVHLHVLGGRQMTWPPG